MTEEVKPHTVIRTSPKGKGAKFVGRCIDCGKENIEMSEVWEGCTGDSSLEDLVIRVIED